MTKATIAGRRLQLDVEGLEPFYVDPVPANRGRYLTDLFILGALGQLPTPQVEAIFIEAFGPANYVRGSGFLVDQYDTEGRWLDTYGPDGRLPGAHGEDLDPEATDVFGLRYVARLPRAGEEFDAEPIRQEELEALALIAFYWQTVAGLEAVKAFIEEGEGAKGSLKAMSLLQWRLGLSPSKTSRSSALESQMQQADTQPTTTPSGGAMPVELPAISGITKRKAPGKGASFFRR